MRRRLSPGERKKEILAVAARAFAKQPYEDVHIDAVAREAGASRALVNHYFRDKRGLFLAVVAETAERLPKAVRADLGLPVEEMVAANTAAWLDLIEADRHTFLMYVGAGPLGRDPQLESLLDRLRDSVVARILANHFGDTELPATAHSTMKAALAMMERAAYDWITGAGPNREQTQALISQTILTTVRQIIPAVEAAGRD